MISISANTMKPLQKNGQLPIFHVSLLIYTVAMIVIFLSMTEGVAQVSDVDDRMRELQIRHLLSPKGQWFDFQLPFIAMPEPYFSPWSRLVDLPYVIVTASAEMLFAPEVALNIALFIVPLLLLVPFSFLAALLLTRMVPLETFSTRMQIILIVCMVCFLASVVQEFSPGRIDHHNVQILAMMMLACGLMLWSFNGGVLIGSGAAISLVTGLEVLPLVVVVWAGLILSYLVGTKESRRVLLGACMAMFIATIVCAFAFLGPASIRSVQCDAFSAPYILPMILVPLSICGSLYFTPRAAQQSIKAAAFIVPLLIIVAVTACLFPQCLQGPYGMLGPLEHALWFDRLLQEKNFLQLYSVDTSGVVPLLGAVTGLVFFALIPVIRKGFQQNTKYLILYAVMACALILALLMARYLKFALLFIPFFLFFSVHWWRQARADGASILPAVFSSAASVLVFAGSLLMFSKGEFAFHPTDLMQYDQCQGQDMSVLATLSPGRIISPQGLAMPLAATMPDGFSIASAPFHRTAPGMRRVFTAFLSNDVEARKQALAPFDYVVVCRLGFELSDKDAVLYTALATGQDWPGLERIITDNASDLQVFRIDHSRLR